MTTLLALPGSLRQASFNAALARAAAHLAPDGVTVEVASIQGIPLYDGDLEASEGIPQPVQVLKDRIAAADGLLLITPEYNNSIPGVFKNAIDWLSRPPADISRVFGDKPVALLGATPGGFGTLLAQNAWLPVLRALGARLWFGQKFYVAAAHKAFDNSGQLADAAQRQRLGAFLAAFADFVGKPTAPG